MNRHTAIGFPALKPILAALAAVALALALAGCSASSNGSSTAEAAASASESAASSSASTETQAATGFKLDITAPDWDAATSTPIIAALEPFQEGAVDTKPLYIAVDANETVDVKVDPGLYKLTLISGVNQDGSLYLVPATQEVTSEALEGQDSIYKLDLELVSAETVTPEQMEHVIAATTVATQDLQDADGQAVMEAVIGNAQNAAAVTDETISAAQDVATQAMENGEAMNVTLNIPPQNETAI